MPTTNDLAILTKAALEDASTFSCGTLGADVYWRPKPKPAAKPTKGRHGPTAQLPLGHPIGAPLPKRRPHGSVARPLPKRRPPRAAALAALGVLADAGEVVTYGSCPVGHQMDYGAMLKYILVGILLGLFLAVYLWWTCCRKVEKVKLQQKTPVKATLKKATRSVMTQSQVTYTRKWSQPRYHPVPEDCQGVSIDLDDFMRR